MSRLPAPEPVPRLATSLVPALAPPCYRPWFCLALACRFCIESPRVPPYWLASDLSECGTPPRCCGLCCQLPFPRFPPLTRFPPLERPDSRAQARIGTPVFTSLEISLFSSTAVCEPSQEQFVTYRQNDGPNK